MTHDYAFEMAGSAVRFGFGVTREVGADLEDLGKRHALVFTDPELRALPPVATVLSSLEEHKIRFSIFDRVRVEPTDESFREAVAAAQADDFDCFVAVGGGSTIDTAKAANLYSCYPAEFLDYVNPPIGKGKPVPGTSQNPDCNSDDGGHGQRNHRRGDFRLRMHACQDGHCQPEAETNARPARSREHAHAAACGRSLDGARRVESRRRVLHYPAF